MTHLLTVNCYNFSIQEHKIMEQYKIVGTLNYDKFSYSYPSNSQGQTSVLKIFFSPENKITCFTLPLLSCTAFNQTKLYETVKSGLQYIPPGFAHARPSAQPPIDVSKTILEPTCLQSHLQTSPPTPQKSNRIRILG